MNERASSCVRAPMSRHCRAASPSAATVSSACTSGEASPYAPKASPARVWPNERSRSRMGLVPGALYCRSAARAAETTYFLTTAERYSPAHLVGSLPLHS